MQISNKISVTLKYQASTELPQNSQDYVCKSIFFLIKVVTNVKAVSQYLSQLSRFR